MIDPSTPTRQTMTQIAKAIGSSHQYSSQYVIVAASRHRPRRGNGWSGH